MDLNSDSIAGLATLVNSLLMWPIIQNLKKAVESLRVSAESLATADVRLKASNDDLDRRVTRLENK